MNRLPRGRMFSIWGPLVGIGIWLGFPNDFIQFPPAILLWPIGLLALARQSLSCGEAFRKGLLASWAGCFAALYWLYLPVADVGQLPLPLALACAALISFVIASQGGFFASLAVFSRKYPAWTAIILLASAWYLLEYAYARAAGFPWLPLSGALAAWPLLLQPANLFGAYMLGAAWVLIALICFFVFTDRLRPRLALSVAGFLGACLLAFGAWRLNYVRIDDHAASGPNVSAIMIDGNIDQNQKWIPAFQQASLDKYILLTDQALAAHPQASGQNSLIIWPETALPFFFQRSPFLAEQTRQAVNKWQLPLLFGAPGVETANGKDLVYNRAFLMAPDGRISGSYDKEHLVPFGEYLPDWLKLDFLEALLQGVGVYQAGSDPAPLRYGDLALGMLICYEGIFPWLAQERVTAGANILVDISNDGWFRETPAARQHLLLTAMRCVEQNRWLLRATNTGITAVVDPAGRIVAEGSLFKDAFLNCRAGLEENLSCFHRLSFWLPYGVLALFCMVLSLGHKRGSNVKEK